MHPVLEQLHWLSVSIDYKVATLDFKVRSTGSPVYLRNIITDYKPTRELRSSNQLLLSRSSTRTEIARRAFSQAAPFVSINQSKHIYNATLVASESEARVDNVGDSSSVLGVVENV